MLRDELARSGLPYTEFNDNSFITESSNYLIKILNYFFNAFS